MIEVSELVRERESDLNAAGPNKTVVSAPTGQTGCPDRSGSADRKSF